MRLFTLLLALLFVAFSTSAQNVSTVAGTVRDRATQEVLPGVSITLEGTEFGTATDAQGRYRLTGVPAGSYNLRATFVGYDPLIRANIALSTGNVNTLNLELNTVPQALGEVTVTANRAIRVATAETPLSVQRLTTEEIKSNPGGNFDISRVVQSLPGVGGGGSGGTAGFRNDIIIRGGAPNENVYYLDGIEVPVINHFSTQGSAGGPAGILNVSFIEDVTLSSSAFQARYDNALSAVLQFRQRDGNSERIQGNLRTSGTEVAATLEGPLTKNTTFLASARRSYLQLLFKLIDLPIRPDFYDFQFKTTTKLSDKTTLTTLGLGAIDHFEIVAPKNSSPEKEYVLRSNPTNDQWNYTVGVNLRHLVENGFVNVALSRTQLYNSADQFEYGFKGQEEYRKLGARANEIENKLRADVNKRVGRWQYSYGAVGQLVHYDNNLFNRLRSEVRDANGALLSPAVTVRFKTDLDFLRYGAFAQATRTYGAESRLTVSAGVRTDGTTALTEGYRFDRTLSPRVSLSYALRPTLNLNASLGRYFKIPPSTILGFRDEAGTLVNAGGRYIRSDHAVAGLEWLPGKATRFTLEGFYKKYANYPVSVRDGISLANLGGDFNAIGNEAVTSTGQGRAYGTEAFFQQKLSGKLFAIVSLTAFRSEFTGRDGIYKPSAWDSQFLGSALLGYQLGRGWEVGAKYRIGGGSPFTPYDEAASRASYQAVGTGVLDYSQLNTRRLGGFQQLDLRLDKKISLRRLSFDFYVDVQNALLTKPVSPPIYTFERTADNAGYRSTDGLAVRPDGGNAIPLLLGDNDALVVPTVGFIIEF
ncbi:TonB-dependent receptor [Hymenobacter arizonensis]|uniref:Outer membrane receptor proteins, mostly Fe transport n=1 Tax=Hymenobacter arizonensis TaxID=1227077 RepID=A0A1I5XIL2_HYMAR|nr:TonB-dependent receptor [Hymenobacter arizonensis]SFQ31791.1 Outer membrane receptor proteins, mostly Fe transport [Hymenobacter arizonensis]